MCFSQFAQYAPRPVYQYEPPERPESAPPTKADLDENLYGPKPLPPQWQQPVVHDHGHDQAAHHHNGNGATGTPAAGVHIAQAQASGSATVSSVTTQTVEAVVVELSNGTKLLICPL